MGGSQACCRPHATWAHKKRQLALHVQAVAGVRTRAPSSANLYQRTSSENLGFAAGEDRVCAGKGTPLKGKDSSNSQKRTHRTTPPLHALNSALATQAHDLHLRRCQKSLQRHAPLARSTAVPGASSLLLTCHINSTRLHPDLCCPTRPPTPHGQHPTHISVRNGLYTHTAADPRECLTRARSRPARPQGAGPAPPGDTLRSSRATLALPAAKLPAAWPPAAMAANCAPGWQGRPPFEASRTGPRQAVRAHALELPPPPASLDRSRRPLLLQRRKADAQPHQRHPAGGIPHPVGDEGLLLGGLWQQGRAGQGRGAPRSWHGGWRGRAVGRARTIHAPPLAPAGMACAGPALQSMS